MIVMTTITMTTTTIKMTRMVMMMTKITIMTTTTEPMTGIIKAFTRLITFTTMKTFTIMMTMIRTNLTMTTSTLTMIISFLFQALPTQMPFPYSFDDNKFLVRWRFDDQADKIRIHLRVKTTGWIGFGFAQTAPNNMRDYDVIVGGFKNDEGYLWVSSSFSFNSRALRRGQRETGDDLGCHGPQGLHRYKLFLNKSFHVVASEAIGNAPRFRSFMHNLNWPACF